MSNDALTVRVPGTRPTERSDLPGDTAMWIFVLGDMLIFSSYFIVYLVKRLQAPGLFLESQQHVSVAVGVLNTLVLLTSSWCIASAVRCAERKDDRNALRMIWLCGAAGVLFVLIKAGEWSAKIGAGLTFTASEYFSFYYFFTGIHLAHVLLGLGILVVVASRYGTSGRANTRLVQTGATYWHMVDLLWVIILALLYMLR